MAIPPEQIAQVELDRLARGRDPCPVEARQLLVALDTWDAHFSHGGQAGGGGMVRVYRIDDGRIVGAAFCGGNEVRVSEHKGGGGGSEEYGGPVADTSPSPSPSPPVSCSWPVS